MSPRSIYLPDQADKCRWHANNIGDSETQDRLRKLAAEYVAEADEIESKESGSLISQSTESTLGVNHGPKPRERVAVDVGAIRTGSASP
jgi:hypothetical protein